MVGIQRFALGPLQSTATPTGTPGSQEPPAAVAEWLGQWLAEWLPIAWGFQEKAAVSVGLALFVVVLGRFVAPWSIARVRRTYRERLATEQFDELLARLGSGQSAQLEASATVTMKSKAFILDKVRLPVTRRSSTMAA